MEDLQYRESLDAYLTHDRDISEITSAVVKEHIAAAVNLELLV